MIRTVTKTAKTLILAAILLFGVAAVLPAGEVAAESPIKTGIRDVGGSNARPLTSVIKTVVNVLLYFIGALSVIMIIYGGFKYITSSGESSGITSAKNTILYALIGLIIAVLAFSIVNFAVKLFDDGPASGGGNATPDTSGAVDISPDTNPNGGNIGGAGTGQPSTGGLNQGPGTGGGVDIGTSGSQGGGNIGGN